jgi:HlyD family secretion protein
MSPWPDGRRLLDILEVWGAAILFAASVACGTSRASSPPLRSPAGEATVRRGDLDDVFLLTGELQAVHSTSLVTPRAESDLQIRWMAEDGADVKEGDRVVDLDAGRLIQSMEDRRLRLRQAEVDLESHEHTAAAEIERKRVAVEKAVVERDKARIDAAVPREIQPAVEWQKKQNTLHEQEAALEKATLDRAAYAVAARSDVEVARVAVDKARRELDAAERQLSAMSAFAPKSGIFLIGNFYQWGPEGPRKLQPGDTVWPGYPLATIPDPSEMQVTATLPEVDHGRVSTGMAARCVLDTYPDRVFEGRIEEIGAIAAEPSQRFQPQGSRSGFLVRVSVARADPLMRPGLSVRVEVVRRSWKRALFVPRRALRLEGGQAVVERKGLTGASAVRVSDCTPLDCIVDGSLAEGDRVLVF